MNPATFRLDGQKAILQHVNLRKEGKEDSRIPACDLKFQCVAPSDVLLAFAPTLRIMLYNREDGSPRYPKMGPIDWDAELRNYLLDITVPPRRKPVELTGVKLKSFTFRPMHDWKLSLVFSAQAYPANGEAIADQLHRALLEDVIIDVRLNGDLLEGAEQRTGTISSAAVAAAQLHELAKSEGATATLVSEEQPDKPLLIVGDFTNEIRAKVRAAGKAEGQKPDGDLEKGMPQCWRDLGLAEAFVEEHLAELEREYVDGYEEGLAG